MSLLVLNNLSKRFGGLWAVKDLSLNLEEGQLVGLIGPNGAGKTTVFNLLTGIYRPDSGNVLILGKDISKQQPERIVLHGITRTFQSVRIFPKLTVEENLKIACFSLLSYNIFHGLFALSPYRRQEKQCHEYMDELMMRFHLNDYASETSGELPYIIQRRLELARAMATKPKILLLDEPTAGMNMEETQEYIQIVQDLRKTQNVAVLLIEHAIQLVMDICERIIVMDYGSVIAEGVALEIQNNPKVIEAYLGSK